MRKSLRTNACWVVLFVTLFSTVVEGAVRRVKFDAPGPSHDGQSWATAYLTIQDGLADSQSTEIWVAAGAYKPAAPGTPIDLVAGKKVFGGFNGTESLLTQRNLDPFSNGTIISGDLGSGAFATTVVRGNVTMSSLTTWLDGFTITGGKRTTSGNGCGISLTGGASPTIQNCRIIGNVGSSTVTTSGGGLYCINGSNPAIDKCTFENNSAASGGAISSNSTPIITNCIFKNNGATGSSGAGGAILFAQTAVMPTITSCTFVDNYAFGSTGGGGAISNNCRDSGPTMGLLDIKNSIFIGNLSQFDGGGAIANNSLAELRTENCLFLRNVALRNGGAIRNSGSSADAVIVNCTFYANVALLGAVDTNGLGGGLRLESGATATISNSVFWNNTGNDSVLERQQISFVTAAPSIKNCSIKDLIPGGMFDSPTNTNNLGSDPAFLNEVVDNLRLRSNSPCLNNGLNSTVTTTTDLDGTGHTRILTTTVDRGAYEYGRDCDVDETPDNLEIVNGTAFDCNNNGNPDNCEVPPLGSGPDCNANSIPDSCEIATGTSQDCNSNGIPDTCDFGGPDCNRNCHADSADIACGGGNNCGGFAGSYDCNINGMPDECESADMVTWTTDADFDRGMRINLTDLGAELQRLPSNQTAPLPYIWVSASGRDTVVRVNTDTGAIEGEYLTGPEYHNGSTAAVSMSPSRTTVDLDGSVWVGNRNDSVLIGGLSRGSVVKVGLVIGGTRTGQYLAPPFSYCTCEDRNGDGLIRTSSGLGNALPWTNWNGADDNGGVEEAEDECILRYTRTLGTGTRTIALDKSNDIWVGGNGNRIHEKINGFTGVSVAGSSFTPTCPGSGYGGLMDCNGVLWSASRYDQLLRYVVGSPPGVCYALGTYGLGFSSLTGRVWATTGSNVLELNANGGVLQTHSHMGTSAQGLAVDNSGTVWVAHGESSTTVRRLASDGTLPATLTVGSGPTGVAVDRNGKVWVANEFSNDIMRINPTPFPGAVDLTVSLGSGALPYNYSDMTGMVGLQTTGTGTWNVVHDGVIVGTPWYRVLWNQDPGCLSMANDPRIVVDVRADDNRAALPLRTYTRATTNGMIFTSGTVVGRFVEIRVRFTGSCPGTTFDTPVLCSLTLQPVYAPCCKADTNFNGYIDNGGFGIQGDLQEFINILLGGGLPCHSTMEKFCRADLNDDGRLDNNDLLMIVNIVLNMSLPVTCPCVGCNFGTPGFYDCNNNQIDDRDELAQNPELDCNLNNFLDECDAVLGPEWGITDCNENNIGDERDVKAETSPDCNQNDIPDECDIASGHSPDWDHDGVPDECALESFMSMGSQMSGEGSGSPCADPPENLDSAWMEFYLWSFQQCWGPNCPTTGAEQYQAIVDKKCELGLQNVIP